MAEYDFHSHSDFSDGTLTPEQLVERAESLGIKYLALTDHDSVSGLKLAESAIAKNDYQLELVKGIEVSAGSEIGEIHIVGLGIDPDSKRLMQALEIQQSHRWERAQKICDKLTKCRVEGVWDMLKSQVREVVTRTHIARCLVQLGTVPNQQSAFKKYLGKSGRAKVPQTWMPISQAISLIKSAGGKAVLAHPTRYPLSNRKLSLLIDEFVQEGGEGIEISYPSINKDKMAWLKLQQQKHRLYVSGGSDFHYPDLKWTDLGRFPHIDPTLPHVMSTLS